MEKKEFAKDLLSYLDAGPTAYHAVATGAERLRAKGFRQLDEREDWKIEAGGKYHTVMNDSALFAFAIGENPTAGGFRLVGAHTDSPSFKLKENAAFQKEGFVQLNVEPYGGVIASTWFDRPLSLAGRVALRSEDPMKPSTALVNIDRDLLVIANLAIHMNRTVNDGYKYNMQKDLLPILSLAGENGEKALTNLLCEAANASAEEIIGTDLYLYDRTKGCLLGAEEEFISSGRLDNLAMVHCGLQALLEAECSVGVNFLAAFDNEEVGSLTMQGANSVLLDRLLERIGRSLGIDAEDMAKMRASSFMISGDMAHSVHPNYPEKADPINKPVINGGPVIKISASKSYVSDGMSVAVFRQLAQRAGVTTQVFSNRSDARGGSTIGPISEGRTAIAGVDVGNPVLGMHSIRELGGVSDHFDMYNIFRVFFSIGSE